MEVILSIVGGSAGAAIVAGIFGLIQWKLNRNAKKEDSAEARSIAVCQARGEELEEVKRLVGVACVGIRESLHDRIKYLGKSYIARGYVTVEELEDLNRMHSVYHDKDKLNGNGFLDNLMYTVNHQLEVRAK